MIGHQSLYIFQTGIDEQRTRIPSAASGLRRRDAQKALVGGQDMTFLVQQGNRHTAQFL